jgi:hypothetical protein
MAAAEQTMSALAITGSMETLRGRMLIVLVELAPSKYR